MADLTFEYIEILTKKFIVSDNAFNYEMKKEGLSSNLYSIFDYYDENKDKVLQQSELEILKKDMESVNNDKNKDALSKNELISLWHKIFPNKEFPNDNTLEEFLKHVQINYINTIENISDGFIDLSLQSSNGDCWLLSQVRALSSTEWGAKAIKESIIDDRENRVFRVKLAGVNFSSEISYDEIETEKNNPIRPFGDIDVLLIELATEKYFKQEIESGNIRSKNPDNPLFGGYPVGNTSMQYLLTGKQGRVFYLNIGDNMDEEWQKINNELLKKSYDKEKKCAIFTVENSKNILNLYNYEKTEEFVKILANKNDAAITVTFKRRGDWNNRSDYNRLKYRNKFDHQSRHTYQLEKFITDSNGEVIDIILKNPWYPDIKIHKTLKEFIDQTECIGLINESENYDDLIELAEPSWVNIE